MTYFATNRFTNEQSEEWKENAEDRLRDARNLISQVAKDKTKAKGKGFEIVKAILNAATAVLPVVDHVADVVADVHPAAKLAVDAFKGVISFAKAIQGMDVAIAAVCHSMTILVALLWEISEESNKHLDTILESITETIDTFSAFVQDYYKKARLLRMAGAIIFKDRLEKYAKDFDDKTGKLDRMLDFLIASEVKDISQDVKTLLGRLDEATTAPEKQVLDIVRNDAKGDWTLAMSNDKVLTRLTAIEGFESTTLDALKKGYDDLMAQNAELLHQIFTSMDEGPHDRIDDEMIKEVWKKNFIGRSAVHGSDFITVVCSFLQEKMKDGGHGLVPYRCGTYLSVVQEHPYYRTLLADIIDSDGSGTISCDEANSFFKRAPGAWNAPTRVIFWGCLWYYTEIRYHYEIHHLLDRITARVQLESEDGLRYSNVIALIQPIISSVIDSETPENTAARKGPELQAEYKDLMEAHLLRKLANRRFELQASVDVEDIIKDNGLEGLSHPIEFIFRMLLTLVLRHHLDYLQAIIPPPENPDYVGMAKTLLLIFQSFHGRYERLRATNGHNIRRYARGVFKSWDNNKDMHVRLQSAVSSIDQPVSDGLGDDRPQAIPSYVYWRSRGQSTLHQLHDISRLTQEGDASDTVSIVNLSSTLLELKTKQDLLEDRINQVAHTQEEIRQLVEPLYQRSRGM